MCREDSSDLRVIVYLNVNSLNKISLKRKLGGGGGGGRNLDDVYCLLPDFIRVQMLNNTPIGELCRLNINFSSRARRLTVKCLKS